MNQPRKIASLELARVIALIAIVFIHVKPFMDYALISDEPWVNFISNQLARFAVPIFFLISGYLIQPKLIKSPWETAKVYSVPLIKIWLVWSIVSLAMPFNLGVVMEHGYLAERQGYWDFLLSTPLNSFLEGGLVHLWFIPSLVIAVYLIAAMIATRAIAMLVPVALVLYLYGVLAGSYQIVTELNPPFFTRNGPFFSLLMVVIGFEIRRNTYQMSNKLALLLCFGGMALHFVEAAVLHSYGQTFHNNDFLIGTALWGTGIFFWLLNHPEMGDKPWVHHLAQWVLPIYAIHLILVIVMFNVAGILAWQGLAKDCLAFFGSLILSYLLARALAKTPLSFSVQRR